MNLEFSGHRAPENLDMQPNTGSWQVQGPEDVRILFES